MPRLDPKTLAAALQLQAQGDGVYTVVVQGGAVRQVGKRSKDVDNGERQGLFSPTDAQAPGVSIEKL